MKQISSAPNAPVRHFEDASTPIPRLPDVSAEPQSQGIPVSANMGSGVRFTHPPGRLVPVRDTHLWVESDGQGEPLILLAGGPASSHVCFHPYFSALAGQFQVVYYDYWGRGRSGLAQAPETVTFSGDVEDLEALREQLGFSSMRLYGFSYGGLIAQQYALSYPDRVSHLVLANTLHSPEMWQRNHENINRELENQYPEVWQQIEELRAQGHLALDGEMATHFAKHGPVIRWFNPDHASLLATEAGARNSKLYRAFAGADIDFIIGGQIPQIPDFRPRLKELKMPVLILAGRHDRALYPKLQMDFKRSCPQARFVMMERSGTFSHVEEPDAVMALLAEFLTKP